MNWSKFNALFWVTTLCAACTSNLQEGATEHAHIPNHIIDIAGLKEIIAHDSVVLIDIRKPEAYQLGHLPGAINIYRSAIEADTLPYGGMMASKQQMEQLFSNKGIKNSDFLVLYDDRGSCEATRLWWILDYYGFQKTAILNGGLKEWMKGDSLVIDFIDKRRTAFTLSDHERTNRYIGLEAMRDAIADTVLVIIDSRTPEEYRGERLKNGAFDQGRIPGSINIDWSEAINYDEGTFKSVEEIQAIYAAKGIGAATNVVVYCHSGVRSAHTTFVLTALLGYKNVRNFDGSWIEWTYHHMPLERTPNAHTIN
jgi:thiosulfate/3-mercaptopyruvate sulfurtransferase